ncbi:MAG: SPOR domain-containing protein [Deltaproteobacteria bacterium]|nr:SPOR domain-containing protein [Deltaproteobacteria bacterium]
MNLKANKRPHNYLLALIAKPLTILWLGGVLVLIVASLIPQAGLSEIDSGFGKDKIARVIIFALLAFYPAAFFPSIRMGLIISTSIAPLGFLLELFQRYVPGRNFSPEDMIANNVGAVVGILLALTIRFFFRTGHSKQRLKTSAPDTPFTTMEDDKPREQGQKDEVAKTPKKSWKSKLIIFSLLLVMGYIAWVTFIQNKPGPPLPTLTKPSPAKTVIKEKTQTNTAPDHPIRYRSEPDRSKTTLPKTHISGNDLPVVSPPSPDRQPQQDKKPQPPPTTTPEPELIPGPEAMEDSPPPFFETELQTSPVESPPEKTSLIDQGEKDSHEPAIPPDIEITPEQDSQLLAPATSTIARFSLRLGAFLEKNNAEGLVSDLKKKGYKPYIFEATDDKNRTWYAVQLSDHAKLSSPIMQSFPQQPQPLQFS